MATLEPQTLPATGVLHVETVMVDGMELTVAGDLSLTPEGQAAQVLAEIQQVVNKRTHNYVVGGQEIVIDYNNDTYQLTNALVPTHVNTYTFIDADTTFDEVPTRHFRSTELYGRFDPISESWLRRRISPPEGAMHFTEWGKNTLEN